MMKEDELLFKLGFALVPALLLVPLAEGTVLFSFVFAASLFISQAVLALAGKLKKPFLKEGIGAAGLLAIVAGADAACNFCLPALTASAGIFFPAILLNGLLIFKNETLETKSKIGLVFVFALLGGHVLLARGAQWAGPVHPGTVFLGTGFFLACLKYSLQKRWLAL